MMNAMEKMKLIVNMVNDDEHDEVMIQMINADDMDDEHDDKPNIMSDDAN